MSVVDADGVYRTTFDPSTEPACVAIVEAIETALGSASSDWVLADSIDPDTLQRLYRADSPDSWMLSFAYDSIEITLWASGRIHVDTTDSTLPAESSCRSSTDSAQPVGATSPPAGPTL